MCIEKKKGDIKKLSFEKATPGIQTAVPWKPKIDTLTIKLWRLSYTNNVVKI